MILVESDLERLSFWRRCGVEKSGGDQIGVGKRSRISYCERTVRHWTSERSPEINQLLQGKSAK